MHKCNKKEAATKTFESHTLINRNVYMPYHIIYTKAHSLKCNRTPDDSIYNAYTQCIGRAKVETLEIAK